MAQICMEGFFRKRQHWDSYLNILKSPQWGVWQRNGADMAEHCR